MAKQRKTVLRKGGLHLITSTCFQRREKLGLEKHRSLLCQLLEELRHKHGFEIVGYVVMPTFLQMLVSEPQGKFEGEPIEAVVLALRQRYQRRYNVSARSDEPAWEKTFADLAVVRADHIVGCLSLMHEAPVKAGLAEKASDWEWSSARRYAGLPEGVVTVAVVDPAA